MEPSITNPSTWCAPIFIYALFLLYGVTYNLLGGPDRPLRLRLFDALWNAVFGILIIGGALTFCGTSLEWITWGPIVLIGIVFVILAFLPPDKKDNPS